MSKNKNLNRDFMPKILVAMNYLKKNFDAKKNSVTGKIYIKKKHEELYQELNLNDIYIELCTCGVKTSMKDLEIYFSSTKIPDYNPFEEYFESVQTLFDVERHGDYIAKFSGYIKVSSADQERWAIHLKKWLVRATKCALEKDYFNKNCITVVSKAQNTGKSTFTRFLAPIPLKDYVVENLTVEKDSLIALTENFLCIMDELASLSKLEINALKAIFSRKEVKVRAPYARKAEMRPRTVSFIGSTNRTDFLFDETGSVRWLCFDLENINWEYATEIDINIVWSQAYQLYKEGFKCELSVNEILENEQINKSFTQVTPEQELLNKYFQATTKEEGGVFMTATEILNKIGLETSSHVRLNVNNLGKALVFSGFERVQERQHNGQAHPVHGYFVKLKSVY